VTATGSGSSDIAGAAPREPRRRARHRTRIVNRKPSRSAAIFLGLLPFLIVVVIYAVASADRLADNPQDRLLPSLAQMWETFRTYAFTPDQRTGDYLLWTDTYSSLKRLFLGLIIAGVLALTLGISIGFLPMVRAGLGPFVAAISLIPPLAVLPILFLLLGLGDTAKVALIVIGIAPIMVRSVARSVAEIPEEQIIKAETLGASTWQMITRLALPQAMPPLVSALRLGLGPAWIFLISAEGIQATDGLGYRIFLVRRYLAMDVILPYVAWITLIAYLIDLSLRLAARRLFRWAYPKGASL
jgi:NitT/TauT family transport system permease protein